MRLARNIVWNAAGFVLPLFVGFVTVPLILRGLGTVRFGFLSIVWMLIGYFSMFDLGLSRTLTKWIADCRGAGRHDEIPGITVTTLLLVMLSSGVLSCLLFAAAPWIAAWLGGAQSELRGEATAAVRWLSVSLPFVLVATVLTGLLEAYQRFSLINMVRVPVGSLLLALPLAVLPFSRSVAAVTAALVVLRVLNTCLLAYLAVRQLPALVREPWKVRRELLRPLLTYGGWLTVSNVIGPLMVYFDRFLIAAILGGAAVAFYTVPYDVLNRVLLIPTAIQGVLFPAFVMLYAEKANRIVAVFERSSSTTLLLMLPPLVATMLLSDEGLRLWVGPDIAAGSADVARILSVGVVFNAMARTPFVFVQGVGHAKWTAALHLVEFPFYAGALVALLIAVGTIQSAAYAWTVRVLADTVILYLMCARIDPKLRKTSLRDLASATITCAAALLLRNLLPEIVPRITLTLIVCLVSLTLVLGQLKGSSLIPAGRSP